jgi:hypothetical protein
VRMSTGCRSSEAGSGEADQVQETFNADFRGPKNN